MPLSAGDKLGPYDILTPIGAGGMGEVYRARDTRLGRDVALKILPGELANDPSRRARFEQEARAVAALNHPNIVAVYDVGEGYIVSELVDGEPLRGGKLNLRKTIEVAVQIANGLAAAHDAGITHRDLKPDNILLTRDERVKILDFGLAKVRTSQPVPANETVTVRTEPGVVMGTVGYMSPEQVRGVEVDHRSDIFSFGIVLHELLTGARPFHGETSIDTMQAILRQDPPDLPETVPVGLQRVVAHCLEKEPSKRFQSASDLAFALRALTGTTSSSVAAASAVPAPTKTRYWIPALALGLTTLLAGFFLAQFFAPPPHPDVFSYRTMPFTTEEENPFNPTISPDGKSIAYNAPVQGITQVFARNLESTSAVQLTHGPEDSRYPFWSPDQSRIYYLSDDPTGRGVWSVGVAGGSPQLVLGGLRGYIGFDGAALSPDGRTLAVVKPDPAGSHPWSVWLSSPPGAAPVEYQPAPFQRSQRSERARLRFSPDGKHLLLVYTVSDKPLELWLLPWPANSSEPPRKVLPSLRFASANGTVNWMPDSRRVLLSLLRSTYSDSHLWIADPFRDSVRQVTGGSGVETDAAVSPDGKTIVYTSTERQMDLVELPLDGSAPMSLLATRRLETAPVWSPVAEQFAYITDRRGVNEIWLKSRREGWSRPIVTPKDLHDSGDVVFNTPVFSPDGSRIAYAVVSKEISSIWVSPVAGGPATKILPDDVSCQGPTWSPDGAWIAFQLRRDGKSFLAKAQVGGSQAPETIQELATGILPQWSPSGEWITVQLPDGFGVVSPDGRNARVLNRKLRGNNDAIHGWSADSSTIYLANREGTHTTLAALDVRSGAEKRIADYGTETSITGVWSSTVRLSMAPDGKSLATSIRRYRGELWMLEGFDAPRNWWQRLWEK